MIHVTLPGALGPWGWLLTFLAHAVIWFVLAFALGQLLFRRAAAARNWLWRVALIAPLASASLQVAGDAPLAVHQVPLATLATEAPVPAAQASPAASPARAADTRVDWMSLLLVALGFIAAVRVGALAGRARNTRRVLRDRRNVSDTWALDLLEDLRRKAKISDSVQLTVSTRVESPVALGTREICLPARALATLDAPALASVLAHELAHIERRDNRWLTVASVLEAVFFVPPLFALARRRLQETAELAADDRAVELTGDALGLAKSLATVAGWGNDSHLALASAARGGWLTARVQRLLDGQPRGRVRTWQTVAAMVCVGAVAVLSPAVGPADAVVTRLAFADNDPLEGSGKLAEQRRSLSGFTRVEVSGGLAAEVTAGPAFSVVVIGDDNLLPHVKTDLSGDTLNVYTTRGVRRRSNLQVRVALPKLSAIEANGAAHVNASGLSGPVMRLESGGASKMNVSNIKGERLELEAGGASHVSLAGSAASVVMEASGASHLDTRSLAVKTAEVEANGASHVSVAATESVTGEASGASRVRVFGAPPKVTIDTSGASSVKHEK